MRNPALIALTLMALTAPLHATTYYLDAAKGSDSQGDGSADHPWASMDRVFKAVKPGDTVLLRPGNYGAVEFGKDQGIGSKAGIITYKADPGTTRPRLETWYESELPRPDPEKPEGKVIFTSITFALHSSDVNPETKTGTPDGHYVTIEGLNVVGGNITFASYVSHVVVRDCNVFGNWGEFSSDVTGAGINLYRRYYFGSNYRHILIEGCYVNRCRRGVTPLGNFHDVTIRNCHFHHFCSTAIGVHGKMEKVLIEGNHAHHQVPLADTKKHTTSVAQAGDDADRIFNLADDIQFHDSVTVTDADTGKTELRAVTDYDRDARRLTLAEPLSFEVAHGDAVVLWDDTHGSGVAVRSSNFTLRGNRIHDVGGTRGIYFYSPGRSGYSDIIIENNLIYSTKNQYTVDLRRGLGDRCVIRNNTFAGRIHGNYHRNGQASMLYGFAMTNAAAAPDADASTIVVANNLFVGIGSAPKGATVKNNIVYASDDFDEDDQGPNADNIVYYDGHPVGQEPRPFGGSGNFFIGGQSFDKLAFKKQHSENLNAAFQLVQTAAAVDAADPATATKTDITGRPRDGKPDVGCYEWRPTEQ